jgi:hypothetical protein
MVTNDDRTYLQETVHVLLHLSQHKKYQLSFEETCRQITAGIRSINIFGRCYYTAEISLYGDVTMMGCKTYCWI